MAVIPMPTLLIPTIRLRVMLISVDIGELTILRFGPGMLRSVPLKAFISSPVPWLTPGVTVRVTHVIAVTRLFRVLLGLMLGIPARIKLEVVIG
jgi:hypothetical protein